MRLAIVADTHMPRGSRRLGERCVAELRAADLILHAGDFIGPSVLAEPRAIGPVVAVHGNVDSPALRRELPESVSFDAAGATASRSSTRAARPSAGAPARTMGVAEALAGAIAFRHLDLG